MGILTTGKIGTPLKEIIDLLGNKSYSIIECRCLWNYEGEQRDDLFGYCSYDKKTGKLSPLDGDSYSLNDKYVKWKEWKDINTDEGSVLMLTVWERGILEES